MRKDELIIENKAMRIQIDLLTERNVLLAEQLRKTQEMNKAASTEILLRALPSRETTEVTMYKRNKRNGRWSEVEKK